MTRATYIQNYVKVAQKLARLDNFVTLSLSLSQALSYNKTFFKSPTRARNIGLFLRLCKGSPKLYFFVMYIFILQKSILNLNMLI